MAIKRNGTDITYRWRRLCADVWREERAKGPVPCRLCGHIIPDDALKQSPWSYTLDHLTPRSVRPDLTLHRDNVQPAHHLCNAVRNNSPLETINATPDDQKLFRRQVEARAEENEVKAERAKRNRVAESRAQEPARTTYHAMTDYGPFCWYTGNPRPTTSNILPRQAMFDPDELPYDEWTGQRRPGVEWPIGSKDYGL